MLSLFLFFAQNSGSNFLPFYLSANVMPTSTTTECDLLLTWILSLPDLLFFSLHSKKSIHNNSKIMKVATIWSLAWACIITWWAESKMERRQITKKQQQKKNQGYNNFEHGLKSYKVLTDRISKQVINIREWCMQCADTAEWVEALRQNMAFFVHLLVSIM